MPRAVVSPGCRPSAPVAGSPARNAGARYCREPAALVHGSSAWRPWASVEVLAVLRARGARSRYEVEGSTEVQDEIPRRELAGIRPSAGPARRPSPSGQPGGQQRFSDLAISTTLTLRLVFRLPLRQAEGFVRSVLASMDVDLEAPDHTTLSRQSRYLAVGLHRVPVKGPIHLLVDSTGLSIAGEGEWAPAKHGGRGQRGWKKLHLGVDGAGVIVAHTLTEATVDDATTGVGLIEALHADLARVTADAA